VARGLAFIAQEVLSGRLDARAANAATAAMSNVVSALRQGELEDRIRRIERATGVTG
jgi:hypothetical protein